MRDLDWRMVSIQPAPPGWRLWLASWNREKSWTEVVSLAGWVALDEIEVGIDEPDRPTGYRVIVPGWVSEGDEIATHRTEPNVSAWVIGPSDTPPTADELRDWADGHRRSWLASLEARSA